MARDHYIPASIIGQFSSQGTGPLRDRPVAVQRPAMGPYITSARNVGFSNNLYQVKSHDHPHVEIDDIWTDIEQRLPEAIALVERAEPVTADLWLRVLVPYVSCLFVRGREWQGRYESRFDESGDLLHEYITTDASNMARAMELQRTLALVTCARWVVVRSQSMQPILNNDLGIAGTLDLVTNQTGWLVPLSTRVAIGIFPRDRRTVATWDGSHWRAVIENTFWPEGRLKELNSAIARFAQEFIVGPKKAIVNRVASDIGSIGTPNTILDTWPFTARERRMCEFLWHYLVVTTHRRTAPPQIPGPVSHRHTLDIDVLLEGWYPPIILPSRPSERHDGLHFRGNTIQMSLRN